MKARIIGSLFVACFAITMVRGARAQLVLYDNFNGTRIDPTKWTGAQFYDPDLRETVRRIEAPETDPLAPTPDATNNNNLHLMHRAYSATTDNSGTSGGLYGLSFTNPSTITTVSFTLVIHKLTILGCSTNPDGLAVTAAEFRGSFFNVNVSPTDSNGDVFAFIDIQRDVSVGTALTAVGSVQEQNGTVLDWQILGTLTPGSKNTLFLKWDQPSHRFIFQLNGGGPVVETYSVSDTTPPFFAFKNLDVARVVPHCTSTPRPYAFVDASFGNVFVNQ